MKKDNQIKHAVDCSEYEPNKIVCECVEKRLKEKDRMIEAVREEAFYELSMMGAKKLTFDFKHYFGMRADLRFRGMRKNKEHKKV